VPFPGLVARFNRETIMKPTDERDGRVLVLLPAVGEQELASSLFAQMGLACQPCADIDELCGRLADELDVAVLGEEALTSEATSRLVAALERQPAWSDLPLVLLFNRADGDAGIAIRLLSMLEPLGQLTVLERPVRPLTLGSAVRAAVRARRWQYLTRDQERRREEEAEEQDQLVARLAHQLRTPLNTILAAVEILGRVGHRTSVATEQRALISRQTHVLARVLEQAQEALPGRNRDAGLRCQPVDLADVVGRCVQRVQGSLRPGHQLAYRSPGAPVMVEGDPARLEQLVRELLAGAIDGVPGRGTVEVGLAAAEDRAVLRVRRPAGIGAVEPHGPCEPAATGEGARGACSRAVQRLVELHGGSLHAGTAGSGGEVVVRLPLASARGAEVVRPVPARVGEGPQRVLLVEDDEDGRANLGLLLRLWGYQVEAAADGPEGVQKALASRPEAAVIDLGLPGLDGYQVARQVRERLGRRVRLIALTGFGRVSDRRQAEEAGFDACLIKPVNSCELTRALAGLSE
jgi:CheY-like chemotaxis protein